MLFYFRAEKCNNASWSWQKERKVVEMLKGAKSKFNNPKPTSRWEALGYHAFAKGTTSHARQTTGQLQDHGNWQMEFSQNLLNQENVL